MNLYLTFKTPDVVDEALQDSDLDEEQQIEAREILSKYIRYGEYITVRLDLKTKQLFVQKDR